jgi:Ca2+-binding EF-hand superfamily protein
MADLQRELTRPIICIEDAESEGDTTLDESAFAAADGVTSVSVWQTLLQPAEAAADGGKFSGIRRQAQQRQSDVQRRLEKAFAVEHKVTEALRARKTYSDVRRIVTHSNIVTSLPQGTNMADLKVSYREQGNLDMYTNENLKKRDSNRHHPEVIGALDEFWNVLPKLPSGKINKGIYTWMCRAMYFKLVKNATEEEFQAVVVVDWRNDAVFSNAMNIRMFRTAIFNMADVWCETVDPREYRDFIRLLRKAVEKAPSYKGKLTEDDDDASAALAARRGSRRPSRVSPPPPEDTETPATLLLRGVSTVGKGDATVDVDAECFAALADEEELVQETLETESQATAEMLRALYDLGAAVETVTEETLLLRAGLMREKQLKLFGDGDTDVTLEVRLIDQIGERATERENRRGTMLRRVATAVGEQDEMQLQGGDFASRVAARTQVHETVQAEHHRFFNVLREAIYKNGKQFAEVRDELAKMEVQRLDVKRSVHVDPYDLEHVQYIQHRANWTRADVAQQRMVYTFIFSDSIQLCRNIEDVRGILTKLGRDALHHVLEQRIAVDGRTGETLSHFDQQRENQLHFGTRRWAAVCDRFERAHAYRNEWSAGILDSIRDEVSEIQKFELKAIATIVEAERAHDKKVLQIIEEDKTIVGAHRDATIKAAVQAARERDLQRDARILALKADHIQMNEDVEALVGDHDARISDERAMLASWRKAQKTGDLAANTVEYVLTLEAGKVRSSLTDTVMTRQPAKSGLATSVGGTHYLPPGITSGLDAVLFVDAEEQSWFGFHAERLLSERLRLCLNAFERYQRRHVTSLEFMATHKVAFLLRRVTDIDEYPRLEKAKLGFLEREIVRQRLEKAAATRTKLQKAIEWKDASIAEAEMLVQADARAHHETRIIVARIFEVERTFRDKHIDLMARWAKLAQYKITLDPKKLNRAMTFKGDTDALSDDQTKARRAAGKEAKATANAKRLKGMNDAESLRKAEAIDRSGQLRRHKSEVKTRDRDQRAQEHRRHLLEEQERRQQERIQREKEEKEKWRKDFVEQEAARKREEMEKKAWQQYRAGGARLEPGGKVRRASNAMPVPTTPPAEESLAPPRSAIIRRKSTDQTGAPTPTPPTPPAASAPKKGFPAPTLTPTPTPVPAKPAKPAGGKKPVPKLSPAMLGAGKGPKKVTKDSQSYTPTEALPTQVLSASTESSPHASMRLKLAAKYATGDLNTSAAQRSLASYEARRDHYLAEHLSNRDIYVSRCKDFGVAPDTEFVHSLSQEELLYDMTSVTFSNRPVHIPSILDVIRFNPVQRLYLRKSGLDDEGCRALCESLASDLFIAHIDLRNNEKVSDVGGACILSLAHANSRLIRVDLDGTQVGSDTKLDITRACTENRDGRDIGRTEFEYIRNVFREMDQDGSGVVTLEELRAFAAREQKNASPISSPLAVSTIDRMTETLTKRVEAVRSHLIKLAAKEGTGDFNLADLICFIFPHWSVQQADIVVARYTEAEEGPALEEMREFVDTYGTNGTLTLQQLAKGLGETADALRTVFGEFDVDNDGRLNLDEFMRFMSA